MCAKTFVITGAGGFIGRAAVARLSAMGHEIRALGREVDVTKDNLGLKQGDHVLHLAGATGVDESWADAVGFTRNNVVGTASVLEQARVAGATVVYLNTYCYGVPQYLPIDEKHPVATLTPYHVTKMQAEALCRFYAEERGLRTTALRVFNVFGPGQGTRFVIPRIIEQVLDPATDRIEVSDLKPSRDFVHVDDLIDACLLVADGQPGFGCYNVGSGRSISVGDLIAMVQALAGVSKTVVDNRKIRRNEIDDVRADTTKLRTAFGWEPRISLLEGLRQCLSARHERATSEEFS